MVEGSKQEDVWGENFMPAYQKITYDSLIDTRHLQNRSMEILDLEIKEKITKLIKDNIGDI
jgi:Protein of unknown function (DUF5674)